MAVEKKTRKAKAEAVAARKSRSSALNKNDEVKPSASKLILECLERIKLNASQQKFSDTIISNKITFCQGPAGTSKTYTACYTALKLLAHNRIKRIVLFKPAQQVKSEELGFIPGDIAAKLLPIVASYRCNLIEILGEDLVEQFERDKILEYAPLAFARGITMHDTIALLDEAQNADYSSLILFITRMGRNSKSILMGDVSQYDINKKAVKFPEFIDLFKDIKEIGTHYYTHADIVREPILIEITERYEKWKELNKL